MPRSPIRRALMAILALSLPFAGSCRADVVRLKNGATIVADTLEERGDDLLIHQAQGTIVVPRSEVASIERAPAAAPGRPGAPGPPGGGGPSGPATSPDAAPDGSAPGAAAPPRIPSREEILKRIDELDRRIRDYPMARAENGKQIVSLLNLLGMQALQGRNDDEALQRFLQALGYDPHNARSQLGLSATYVAQGQDVQARATLELAVLEHPEDADLRTLLGDVYDSQERPEDALAAWKKAYALKPTPALQRRIDKLEREHGIDAGYRQSEAAHFTLKYDGERAGPDLDAGITAYLEEQFTGLVTRFEFYPRQPIVVIVYPKRQFYEATLAESNVAGLFDGKIRVPIGGLQQLNGEARKVLLHELTHAFVAGKSHGTAPRWLQEGLAQQAEGKATSTVAGLALARQYEALSEKEGWGQGFSYESALSFVEFLIEREGFPHLVDVLEAMGKGATIEDAFQRVTRYSLRELRDAWGQALAAKYLK